MQHHDRKGYWAGQGHKHERQPPRTNEQTINLEEIKTYPTSTDPAIVEMSENLFEVYVTEIAATHWLSST